MKEELLEMAKRIKPSIGVIGLGGAGCNITTWIVEKGMAGGKIVAANTNAAHLSLQKTDKRTCKLAIAIKI